MVSMRKEIGAVRGLDSRLGDAHAHKACAMHSLSDTFIQLTCPSSPLSSGPPTTTRHFSTGKARMQHTSGVIQTGPNSNILVQGGQFVQSAPAQPDHKCYEAHGARLFPTAPISLHLRLIFHHRWIPAPAGPRCSHCVRNSTGGRCS